MTPVIPPDCYWHIASFLQEEVWLAFSLVCKEARKTHDACIDPANLWYCTSRDRLLSVPPFVHRVSFDYKVKNGDFKHIEGLTAVTFRHTTSAKAAEVYHLRDAFSVAIHSPNLGDLAVSALCKVSVLDLPRCELIRGRIFRPFVNLRSLNLSKCPLIDDLSLKHLGGVEKIYLSGCIEITDRGIAMLRSATHLDVSKTLITGRSFAGLPNLQTLSVRRCINIQDASFAGLRALRCLNMEATPLRGTHLNTCTELRELNMNDCNELQIGAISGLSNLQRLNLEYCAEVLEEYDDAPVLSNLLYLNTNIIWLTNYMIRSATNLKELTLGDSVTWHGNMDNFVFRRMGNLEVLSSYDIMDCFDAEIFAMLPNLREFKCPKCDWVAFKDLFCMQKLEIVRSRFVNTEDFQNHPKVLELRAMHVQ